MVIKTVFDLISTQDRLARGKKDMDNKKSTNAFATHYVRRISILITWKEQQFERVLDK